MNKTNEKFKMCLTREFNYLETILNKRYNEYEKQKIEEITPMSYTKNRYKTQKLVEQHHRYINFNRKYWQQEYSKLHELEYAELKKLNEIITLYYNNLETVIFDDYEFLTKYLNKFKFSDIECGEVLAYFTNFTILYHNNYRYEGHEEDVRKAVEAAVEDIDQKKTKKEKQKEIEELIKNFNHNQEACYEKYKVIRAIIDEDGNLLPELYALGIPGLYNALRGLMSEKLTKTILSSSMLKARDIKNKIAEEEIKNEMLAMERAKNEATYQYLLERQNQTTIIERNAKQSLKKYLLKDTPICFIGENLDEVISLLKQAGYTSVKINEIRRSILMNDKLLIEKENQNKFKNAKEKYLEVSEISLLNLIETILHNPEAIRNPIFNEIQMMYQIIKEKLISFDELPEEARNYEVEYMGLCIAELRELLSSYRASSYKLVLEQNSN